jgi:hypothetical protein
LLFVAVAPLLLCCGVPALLAVLAGHACRRWRPRSWSEGKCSPLWQPASDSSHWVYAMYQHSFIASSVAFFSGSVCLA